MSSDGGMEAELKHRLGEGIGIVVRQTVIWRNREMAIDIKVEVLWMKLGEGAGRGEGQGMELKRL